MKDLLKDVEDSFNSMRTDTSESVLSSLLSEHEFDSESIDSMETKQTID